MEACRVECTGSKQIRKAIEAFIGRRDGKSVKRLEDYSQRHLLEALDLESVEHLRGAQQLADPLAEN